jgi:[acyl-carrier-protein] S-malonyltransferase
MEQASAWLDAAHAKLDCNRDVQLVVFLSTQLYLAALAAEGIDADCSLGLSLGEYSHLVHIGALTFAQALKLVSERGRCFDAAPIGRMVTVLAVDGETVADVVARAQALGPIVISNYNAPTQHVISGVPEAVEWAAQTLEEESGAHTTIIERRVPMHSPLMAAAARRFARSLSEMPWQQPRQAYRPNVTGEPIAAPSARDFVDLLTRHISEPVRWQTSVDEAAVSHPGAVFVEVGPGCVLHNLLGRAWRPLRRAHVDDPESDDPRAHFMKSASALREQSAPS